MLKNKFMHLLLLGSKSFSVPVMNSCVAGRGKTQMQDLETKGSAKRGSVINVRRYSERNIKIQEKQKKKIREYKQETTKET